MNPITKDQATYIRKRCKELKIDLPPISLTCRDKPKGKRKKRYATMSGQTIRILAEYEKNCLRITYDSRYPERYK